MFLWLLAGWWARRSCSDRKALAAERYQIAAVILTYAAVSIAAIPIWISAYVKAKPQSQSIQLKQPNPSSNAANGQPVETQSKPKPGVGAALLQLLLVGLASPFLELQDPIHGIIGLVILMVGIRIAWQITVGSKRADIQGPYEVSTAASVR